MRLLLSLALLAPASAFACAMPREHVRPLVADAVLPTPPAQPSLEDILRQIDVAAGEAKGLVQGVVAPIIPEAAAPAAPTPSIPEVAVVPTS